MATTTLQSACPEGKLNTVRLLRTYRRTNVNYVDKELNTALHLASQSGHANVVVQLLARGINVNMQRMDGCTALMIASSGGGTEIVRNLLAHPEINVNIQKYVVEPRVHGDTALVLACDKGHNDIVRLLLGHRGIAVNLPSDAAPDGWTALMVASRRGHKEIVKMLLDHPEMDVNIKYHTGSTALMGACQMGHSKIVKMLLARPGIDVNEAHHFNGKTSLMWACVRDQPKVVKALLAWPYIILNAQNTVDDCTPLMYACAAGSTEIVEMLLACPTIRVDQRTASGKTAKDFIPERCSRLRRLFRTFELPENFHAIEPLTPQRGSDYADTLNLPRSTARAMKPNSWLAVLHAERLSSIFGAASPHVTAAIFADPFGFGTSLDSNPHIFAPIDPISELTGHSICRKRDSSEDGYSDHIYVPRRKVS